MTTSEIARPLIVVGVDGSPQGQKAVAWGLEQAKKTGGTLELLIAWARPVSYGVPLVVGGLDPEAQAREIVEKAATELDLPADRVIISVVHGAAPSILIERSSHADLLVVGSRGHGGFAELLLGSVSAQVVHHAGCPAVVIR
jgi:nucleotide-binding universal stress UspA family protein